MTRAGVINEQPTKGWKAVDAATWRVVRYSFTYSDSQVARKGRVLVLRRATVALVVLALLSACSSSDGDRQPVTPAPSAISPSPTIDPRALPAMNAYGSYLTAARNAERHPVNQGEKLPPGADFKQFSFDPARAQFETYIWNLALGETEVRGTPPQSHPTVTAIKLTGSEWPTVTISDCQTGSEWLGYSTRTGKVMPTPTPSVAPPYRSEVELIYYQGHWGVRTVVLDTSQTCTA